MKSTTQLSYTQLHSASASLTLLSRNELSRCSLSCWRTTAHDELNDTMTMNATRSGQSRRTIVMMVIIRKPEQALVFICFQCALADWVLLLLSSGSLLPHVARQNRERTGTNLKQVQVLALPTDSKLKCKHIKHACTRPLIGIVQHPTHFGFKRLQCTGMFENMPQRTLPPWL